MAINCCLTSFSASLPVIHCMETTLSSCHSENAPSPFHSYILQLTFICLKHSPSSFNRSFLNIQVFTQMLLLWLFHTTLSKRITLYHLLSGPLHIVFFKALVTTYNFVIFLFVFLHPLDYKFLEQGPFLSCSLLNFHTYVS